MSTHQPTTLRAVAYYRKSDDDDGVSIGQQREWAQAEQSCAGFTIVREFEEQSRPGWVNDREEFRKMIVFCEAEYEAGRPLDVVVCWDTNRFSRQDGQYAGADVTVFRDAGTDRLYTHSRLWDFARREDRAMYSMEQEFTNHKYVQDLANDSMRGRLSLARQGKFVHGTAPYGYVVVGAAHNKRLALADDASVERVRWIFSRYLEPDATLHSLVADLHAAGVPTPTGKPVWTRCALKHILTNDKYLGRLVWNRTSKGRFTSVVGFKVEVKKDAGRRSRHGVKRANPASEWVEANDTHDPIIDRDTFDAAQRKLAGSRRGRRPNRAAYPLSGLLVCGHCGRRMTGSRNAGPVRKDGGRNVWVGYICYTNGQPGGCRHNGINAAGILEALVNRLQETVFDEKNLRAAAAEIRRQDAAARASNPGRAAELRQRGKDLDRKVALAERRFADEEDATLWALLKEKVQRLRAERQAAAEELAALERHAGRDVDNLDQLTEEAVQVGRQLRVAVADGDTDLVCAMIAVAVEKVELFFTHERQGPKRVLSRFVKGLIHVHEGFPFVGKRLSLLTGQPLPNVLPLLPEHFSR